MTDTWDLRDISWTHSAGSVASDGVFLKSIIEDRGVKYYLKMSAYDSYRGIFGHEAVNELIAYRLGKLLGFPVPFCTLRKALVYLDGRELETYISVAPSFKSVESRETLSRFYNANRLSANESPLDLCKRFSWTDDIYRMFIFDFLIINRDRHGANLEVFKNGGALKLSPFFDNGVSFVFSYTEEADLSSFNVLGDLPVNNFIGTRSLRENLKFIDRRLYFNELRSSDRMKLFEGLEGILPDGHLFVIWEIIWRRWDYVKDFRFV